MNGVTSRLASFMLEDGVLRSTVANEPSSVAVVMVKLRVFGCS